MTNDTINLIERVIPTPQSSTFTQLNRCYYAPTKDLDVTQAQCAQVSILGAPPTRQRIPHLKNESKVGNYPNLVVEQARLVAIQNWINEDRRKYEEKRASQAVDLQSEGGTSL